MSSIQTYKVLAAPQLLVVQLLLLLLLLCSYSAAANTIDACTNNSANASTIMLASNSAYVLSNCSVTAMRMTSNAFSLDNVTIRVEGGSILPIVVLDVPTNAHVSNFTLRISGVRCNTTTPPLPFLKTTGAGQLLDACVSIMASNIAVQDPATTSADGFSYTMFTVQNSIIQNISISIVDSLIAIYQRVPDLSSRIVSIEPAASSFLSSLVDNLTFTMTRSTSNIIGFASNAFVFLLFANAPTATSSWTFSNIKVLIDASSVWIVTQELNAGCAVVSYSSYASVRSSLRGNVHCNVSNSAFYLTASTGSVLVSVDKIIAVSGLDVDVRNTTVEGKILSTDDDAASTAAVVSVIAQRSLEFATIRLHTVTATFVVQCGEPPQLTSSYELAVLVTTRAVTISNTLVSVELSSMFAQRSSTPPKHSTSSSTSPPLLYLFQFSDSHIVSLRKAANASNVSVVLRDVSMFASLNLTMVPIASAFVRLVVMDASLVLNAITLLENSTVIISRSTLVAEVAVTTPSPGSAITNFLGVSCIALIALGDPATIGSARLAAEMPQFVDAFPSSYTATPATLVGCNVAVDNNSFHISAALTQEVYVGIVLLPGAIVGTKLIIENVTLTSPLTTSSSSSNPLSAPWRTSALLCAITCSVNDSSYVRLMSVGTRDSTTTTAISMLTGPLVQIISGDVNPLTVRMIIDRSNITLKGLMASTNIATATSMSGGYTSSPSVVNSSQRVIVRGWSVVDIDGCTFYQYSGSLFGSNVIWDVNATSSTTTTASSLPRIHLGCNAASLGQPTSTSTSLVPINLKLLGGGVPVGIVDYPDDDFTSPYLPQVVCQRATPEEVVTTASPYLVRRALSKRSSAVTTTTSVLIAALIVVQGLLPISASGGIHSLQSTLLARRKQQWCLQTSAANTSIVSDDNVPISDGVDDDSNMCCDIGTSPTQLSIGSNSVSGALLPLLLGAVVANSALVVGLCLLRLLLVAAGRQSAYLATSSSLRGFCHPVGLVAALWMPFTLLMAPTISSVVAIMILPDTSVGIAAFGAFCLCAWSLPWLASIYGLCWRRRKPYPFRGCVPKGRLQRSFKQKLLEPRELLDAPMAARPFARQLLHAYGPVIEGYTARCYWYFNIETMFAFMNGIVMGLAYNAAVRNPCSVWTGWMLFALGVLEPTVAFAVDPFAVLLDVVGVLLFVGLSTISQLMMLLNSNDDETISNGADIIALASALIELLLVAYELFSVLEAGAPRWARQLETNVTKLDAPRDRGVTFVVKKHRSAPPSAANLNGLELYLNVNYVQQEALRKLLRLITDSRQRQREPPV